MQLMHKTRLLIAEAATGTASGDLDFTDEG